MAISVSDLQTQFSARIYRRLAAYARKLFTKVESIEDAVQDVLGLGWKSYRAKMERGDNPERYFGKWARTLALKVLEGRRLQGQEQFEDITSPRCQRRKGIRRLSGDVLNDLTYGADPAASAALRIDVESWLSAHPLTVRIIASKLTQGYSGREVERHYCLAHRYVVAVRKTLESSWDALQAE